MPEQTPIEAQTAKRARRTRVLTGVGAAAKARRLELGKTLEEIAIMLEMTPQRVARFEQGGFSLSLQEFADLCAALQSQANDLLRSGLLSGG